VNEVTDTAPACCAFMVSLRRACHTRHTYCIDFVTFPYAPHYARIRSCLDSRDFTRAAALARTMHVFVFWDEDRWGAWEIIKEQLRRLEYDAEHGGGIHYDVDGWWNTARYIFERYVGPRLWRSHRSSELRINTDPPERYLDPEYAGARYHPVTGTESLLYVSVTRPEPDEPDDTAATTALHTYAVDADALLDFPPVSQLRVVFPRRRVLEVDLTEQPALTPRSLVRRMEEFVREHAAEDIREGTRIARLMAEDTEQDEDASDAIITLAPVFLPGE